jgi:RHS repeat-associated protein
MTLRDRSTQNNGTLDERLWVQQDAIFNVTALVSGSGTVLERDIYDPYGKVTFLTASWGILGGSQYSWIYLLQGGRFDSISGLYDKRERELSSTLGRWLQNDPLGNKAAGLNLYIALKDNPQLFLDPIGLHSKSQDHHWFPRDGGRGQAMVDEICCKEDIKVEIDHFTTAIYDSERGSPHHRLTHGAPGFPKYNDQAKAIYATARDCCDLLKRMAQLILKTYAELYVWYLIYYSDHVVNDVGPWPTFEMHHLHDEPAFPGTIPDYMSLIGKACGKKDPWTKKTPQDWLQYINQQIHNIQQRPTQINEPGLMTDSTHHIGAALIIIWAIGAGAAAAVGLAADSGAGAVTPAIEEVIIEELPQVLKPAA